MSLEKRLKIGISALAGIATIGAFEYFGVPKEAYQHEVGRTFLGDLPEIVTHLCLDGILSVAVASVMYDSLNYFIKNKPKKNWLDDYN